MANTQTLLMARTSAPLSADAMRAAVEVAARAKNFQPDRWAFDSQFVNVIQDPSFPGGLAGKVVGGPWDGITFTLAGDAADPRIPVQGARMVFNVLRQNMLGDGDNAALGTAIRNALNTLAGSSARVFTATVSPTHRVTWDRGIPAPLAFPAEGSGGSSGVLFGIAAVAALAYFASRGSSTTMKPMRTSTAMRGLGDYRPVPGKPTVDASRNTLVTVKGYGSDASGEYVEVQQMSPYGARYRLPLSVIRPLTDKDRHDVAEHSDWMHAMSRPRKGMRGLGGYSKSTFLVVVEGRGIGTQVVEAFASEAAAKHAAARLRERRDKMGSSAQVRVGHKMQGSGRVSRASSSEVESLLRRA
jgi:hypothetical protein